ncbi:hypothetical protein EDB85DRAFT_1885414 [Lactarius pseudohatsudake]|nr:hypothetical protein EDB85DRAFT_1885414 [Lactarius pseudohatsudake]
MTGSPPGPSKVDIIYNILADLPTVDDNGDPLQLGRFRMALVAALSEPVPSLGNTSPIMLMGLSPMYLAPRPPPSTFTKEPEALQDSLNLRLDALQGAIEGMPRTPLPAAPVPAPVPAPPTAPPVSKPHAQKPHAQPPTPAPAKTKSAPATAPALTSRPTPPLISPPSFAMVAKVPWQSLLHDHPWLCPLSPRSSRYLPSPAVRRSPQEIIGHLNAILATEAHQVTLSAARWTAKNNLVVTAGPDTTAHHLTAASHLISDCLATFFSSDQSPLPVQARENCKWARLLINGIPTGASPTQGPFSPSELYAALLANNPAYRGLRLTQPPSWVRAPASYRPSSVSSLVLTFEDPLGDSLRSLLAGRSLFAFGHAGELKRWKSKPHNTGKALAPMPPS